GDPRVLACTREGGVLRQEAVAGMDRLGAGPPGGIEDPLRVQVALGGPARADQVRLVRGAGVEGVAVGLRVDGDGEHAELAKRAKDPNRDLAAVGNEHLPEQRHGRRIVDYGRSLPRAPAVGGASVASLIPVRRQALRYCAGTRSAGSASSRSIPAIRASRSSGRGGGVMSRSTPGGLPDQGAEPDEWNQLCAAVYSGMLPCFRGGRGSRF